MNNVLTVFWEKELVGDLSLDEKRNFVFQYDSNWSASEKALPLSIRLPLRKESFPDDVCRTFFSNLLPEGNVRTLIARKLGISETNDFELLKALGGECAGAISLLPAGREAADWGDYELLTPDQLNIMIENMSNNPLLVSQDELRLSLAGAQQKLPVYIQDGKIYLPRGAYPSSHILKPQVPGFEHIIENEAFSMMLAKKYGLPVPESSMWKGKHAIYLVERYDRKRGTESKLIRLHQEDFCQALGYSYSQKYESEGGPNLDKCFSLLSDHSTQPVVDKRLLLEWIVFNYLIGNCDAHAKNISMLITRQEYKLSPLYDLVSTRVYPKLSPKFAMRIGGQYRADWVLKEHWQRLAQSAGVGFKAVTGICEDMGAKLPDLAAQAAKEFCAQYGSREIISKICTNISGSAKKMLDKIRH